MIPLFGFGMALVIGLCLGIMGSGGSILSVPVLVYLFSMDPVPATAYSLFIVGVTSLIGLSTRLRAGKVDFRATLLFAVPSLIAVFLVRKYVVHALPEAFEMPWGPPLSRGSLIMGVFGLVMLAAALSMLFHSKAGALCANGDEPTASTGRNRSLIGIEGLLVGTITGFVGAGGGFLIVPVMVLSGHLSMETAIGTSLTLIFAQSLVGFLTDLSLLSDIRWPFLLGFTGLSVLGVVAGSFLGRYIRGQSLRRAFGWFTLVVAISILGHEFFLRSVS
ncbi:MAG: sulfite exporter TauE/SafE family protein [Fibrobacterota bacterium]|nr:sulfite exporter TauE/SafE family protein [Fibrobacterota bacterium]